jgi:hypothetical protein
MSMSMYLVVPKGQLTQDCSRELQRFIRSCGGFILMVTRTSLIAALENQAMGRVQKHPRVKFVGPVTLNPRGLAAERLQRIFAENLSQQINVSLHSEGHPAR